MAISVSKPVCQGQVVLVDVSAGSASKYLRSGTFRFRYDGVDLSKVPASILVLPALGAVLTVAYATGTPIEVDEVDELFALSAEELAGAWGAIYPQFRPDGFHLFGRKVRNDISNRDSDLLLFSGGVDALASLVKNSARTGGLLSVWGADVPLSRVELWQRLQGLIPKTTATYGLDRFTVKTNVRRFFINDSLVRDFTGVGGGSWWMKAQHGMALLSLSAPLTVAAGYSRVVIASSHSAEFDTPWGSSPRTDELIKWGNVTVKHDAYDYTRQNKLKKLIAPYVFSGGGAMLAVCYKKQRGQGESINCGACEKCIRTLTGVLVAGMKPQDLGLLVDKVALNSWRAATGAGKVKLSPNEIFMWRDIQSGFCGDSFLGADDELRSYLEWVNGFDFSSVHSIAK